MDSKGLGTWRAAKDAHCTGGKKKFKRCHGELRLGI